MVQGLYWDPVQLKPVVGEAFNYLLEAGPLSPSTLVVPRPWLAQITNPNTIETKHNPQQPYLISYGST